LVIQFSREKMPVFAGPCVLEDREGTLRMAEFLRDAALKRGFPFVFKASFDKANRTSLSAYRGPGLEGGLEILSEVRRHVGVPVITDIHLPSQAAPVAKVADVLQIPAFLCRQTDLLVAAGMTGKPVNIKKGQFMAPWDMKPAVEKTLSGGASQVMLTERGTFFGYNRLVVDLTSLSRMREIGVPVIMDVTHSVQVPGGLGTQSGGNREYILPLARAAAAWGCDGLFLEVHPVPEKALSDGANSLKMEDFPGLLDVIRRIREATQVD
jgi:2-dehydro-3-deoxyphosphooctonate aldolase (KDO 8-P synthase)